MNNKLYADKPIEKPEDALFGFPDFAKNVAESIISLPDGEKMVYSLNAEWGSGKTSCLNLIKHHISKLGEEPYIILDFNPWLFSSENELVRQFFRQLKSAIKKQSSESNLIDKSDIYDIIKLLSLLCDIVAPVTHPTVGAFGKLISLTMNNSAALDIKKEIDIALSDKRVLIIIDDIDRLAPEETACMMKVIKAIADFDNTVYFLAMDHDVVAKNLQIAHGSKEEDYGHQYLKKIVQIPLGLPKIDEIAFRRLFNEAIKPFQENTSNNLLEENISIKSIYDYVFEFMRNIRDVKRLQNSLRVNYIMMLNEVNFSDFIGVETLRLFDNSTYMLVRDNERYFVSDYKKSFAETFDMEESPELDGMDIVPINSMKIIESLFPARYKNVTYQVNLDSRLSIQSTKHFYKYFMYGVREDNIKNQELSNIIDSKGNNKRFVDIVYQYAKTLRSDGLSKLIELLARLNSFWESDPNHKSINGKLKVVFSLETTLRELVDESMGIDDVIRNLRYLVITLLEAESDKNKRYDMLRVALQQSNEISTIMHTLGYLGRQHGKYGSSKDFEEDILIDIEQLNELESIALAKIRDIAQKDRVYAAGNPGGMLYGWKAWAKDEYFSWIENNVNNNEFLKKFIINHKRGEIKKLIDPENIIDRCKLILEDDGLSANEVRAFKGFIDYIEHPENYDEF